MSKLLFDLDGVIITYQNNFAQTYSDEFGIPADAIYQFFSEDYYRCAIGQRDLLEALESYITPWHWTGDAQSLAQYWFDCQNTVDHRMLDLIQQARACGHECSIASDQDHLRTQYIRGLLDVDSIFTTCFFSCDVGATKTEATFFEHVLDSLRCEAHEIYFWDDNPKNVHAAEQAGLHAELYTRFDGFRRSFAGRFALCP